MFDLSPYSQGKVFSIFCIAWSTPLNNNSITSLGLQPMISLKNRVKISVHLVSCENRRLIDHITSGLHSQPLFHGQLFETILKFMTLQYLSNLCFRYP